MAVPLKFWRGGAATRDRVAGNAFSGSSCAHRAWLMFDLCPGARLVVRWTKHGGGGGAMVRLAPPTANGPRRCAHGSALRSMRDAGMGVVWVWCGVASTSDASEIADRREPSQRVLDLVVFNQQ